jgi:hypothetical protein
MRFIAFIVCLLFLFSCRFNGRKDINVQDNLLFKFEKQKEFLYNRAIPSISSVLSDTIIVGKCILLIYDEMDCDDCVKKGFSIINRLDTLKASNIFVVTTSPNPGRNQLLNDYHKYIFVLLPLPRKFW